MNRNFIESLVANADLLEIPIADGLQCYEATEAIFVLAQANVAGPITEEMKTAITEQLSDYAKRIVCVTQFRKRTEMIHAKDMAWGTYAWFAEAPEHYVYFDDAPH